MNLTRVGLRKDKILLGKTEEGVEAYVNESPLVKNKGKSYHFNGYITGMKWECVEFVRRYMMKVFDLSFKNVRNALEMKNLNFMFNIYTQNVLNITHINNQNLTFSDLKKGNIVIINDNTPTGHTAVITRSLSNSRIEIAEQNYKDKEWNGNPYSRVFSIKNGILKSDDPKETVIDIISV